MSGCIPLLSYSHSPVFLLNSCLDLFSAPALARRDPFSRSYRVSLPSSLTVIHPSASVYSTRPRVSVSVRVPQRLRLADFLDSMVTRAVGSCRSTRHTLGFRLFPWICLWKSAPTPFNRLFRQTAAVSLLRPRVTPWGSNGMLTVSAIVIALRLRLRTRLTLIRLALIRKPWSFGEGVSRPLYRYLYLHLLFHPLQSALRHAFDAGWNAPLPILAYPAASADGLIPDYYPRPIPRLVSCYALFK